MLKIIKYVIKNQTLLILFLKELKLQLDQETEEDSDNFENAINASLHQASGPQIVCLLF